MWGAVAKESHCDLTHKPSLSVCPYVWPLNAMTLTVEQQLKRDKGRENGQQIASWDAGN